MPCLAKNSRAAVTVVTVTADWNATDMADRAEGGAAHPVEDYESRAAAWASKVHSACAKLRRRWACAARRCTRRSRSAADGIVETANDRGCDLIVMASHGRGGVSRMLLGSVANKVLTYSTVPVLICR